MSVRVFLIRHAAHDNVGHYLAGRMPGIHLGPDGRAQARRLARRMSRERIGLLHASPVTRAQETAQAIAEISGRPVETFAALDEIDFGAWTGKTFDDLAHDDSWRRWNAARSIAATPNGEMMIATQGRIARHIFATAQAHPGEHIAMVTHADPIRAFMALVLGLSLDRLPALDIAPGSISVVDLDAWGAIVRLVNEIVPEEDRS